MWIHLYVWPWQTPAADLNEALAHRRGRRRCEATGLIYFTLESFQVKFDLIDQAALHAAASTLGALDRDGCCARLKSRAWTSTETQ